MTYPPIWWWLLLAVCFIGLVICGRMAVGTTFNERVRKGKE